MFGFFLSLPRFDFFLDLIAMSLVLGSILLDICGVCQTGTSDADVTVDGWTFGVDLTWILEDSLVSMQFMFEARCCSGWRYRCKAGDTE